jgi:hypothetical protein
MARSARGGEERLAAAAILAWLVLVAIPSPVCADEDALPSATPPGELLDRVYRNLYAADFVQVMTLTTRSASGRTMTRRLQVTRKQSSLPGKALVRFLEPPDIRGTSLLVLERDDRYDDVFLYLPAFDRIRRVSSAQRADAFFGTNLTYEDLEPKRSTDFDARIVGREAVEGIPCVLLEVRPHPELESQYERTVACVDPERAVALWTDHYAKGRVLKRTECDPQRIQLVEGRHVPFHARIASREAAAETLFVTESYETRSAIPDTLFTAKHLMRGDEETDRERSQASP